MTQQDEPLHRDRDLVGVLVAIAVLALLAYFLWKNPTLIFDLYVRAMG